MSFNVPFKPKNTKKGGSHKTPTCMCLNFFTKFKFETIQMVMLYCRTQYPASLHTFFFFYLGLLFFFSDVIHTVGPIGEKEDLLSNAYSSVLGLLKENNLASVVRRFFFLTNCFLLTM